MNLQKGRFGGDGPTTSPMIMLAKSVEREKKIRAVRISYLPQLGIFIGFSSRNPLLHSRGRILSPPSLREEIFFSLLTTSSSCRGIVFPFPRLSFLGVRDLEASKFADNIGFADFLLQCAYSKHTSHME